MVVIIAQHIRIEDDEHEKELKRVVAVSFNLCVLNYFLFNIFFNKELI